MSGRAFNTIDLGFVIEGDVPDVTLGTSNRAIAEAAWDVVRDWVRNDYRPVIQVTGRDGQDHKIDLDEEERPDTTTTIEPGTWTFFGHFNDASELVICHAVEGQHDDVYPENGVFAGGLWAGHGSGTTLEEAEKDARSRYENEARDE